MTVNEQSISEFPELFFGIAAPIGTDIEAVVKAIVERLASVGYSSKSCKITDGLLQIPDSYLPETLRNKDKNIKEFFENTRFKIDFANELCEVLSDAAVMAKIAISQIKEARKEITGKDSIEEIQAEKTCFIIRQLKRPAEVQLLRETYGHRFFLISASAPRENRKKLLLTRIRADSPTRTDETELSHKVETLLNRDYHEDNSEFGQQLRETYHLADLFVDATNKSSIHSTITRFIDLLFGKNEISPFKAEYGMYAAKSASLRSADLSRQVGAAIFSDDGELITQGCNEVPKAFGGTYWSDDPVDFRDIKIGHDPNERQKRDIVRDLLGSLSKAGLLKLENDNQKFASIDDLAEEALKKPTSRANKDSIVQGCLRDSYVMDLTEFGRVVHAEMVAVCDAARLGRSIKNSTLYCTTFPCHNCTKHLLAAGIKCVVYIEPYPKSKAIELHGNEVELETQSKSKVSFIPFTGISPMRYRNLFQKNRRKDSSGDAMEWQGGSAKPYIERSSPTYFQTEDFLLYSLENKLERKK